MGFAVRSAYPFCDIKHQINPTRAQTSVCFLVCLNQYHLMPMHRDSLTQCRNGVGAIELCRPIQRPLEQHVAGDAVVCQGNLHSTLIRPHADDSVPHMLLARQTTLGRTHIPIHYENSDRYRMPLESAP